MTDRTLRTAQAYLAAQAKSLDHEEGEAPPGRFVTISRQAGARAGSIAKALAALLTERHVGRADAAWTVFDQEILHKIIEANEFPESLVHDLEKRDVAPLEGILTDLFGVWPSAYDLLSETSKMIRHLSQLGNAIVIGRAGNIVTRQLPGGLHVRLVGSFFRRVRNLREGTDLGPHEAEKKLDGIDARRRKYLKRYFEKDIDDPLGYDLVVNTDRLSLEGCARILADALDAKTTT